MVWNLATDDGDGSDRQLPAKLSAVAASGGVLAVVRAVHGGAADWSAVLALLGVLLHD